MNTLEQMGIQQWRRRDVAGTANDAVSAKSEQQEGGATAISGSVVSSPLAPTSPPEILDWSSIETLIHNQVLCPCCAQTGSVLEQGSREADCMIVVSEPSASDIAAQHLLSGRSGQLLDAILHAMHLSRENIYLSSVHKCAVSEVAKSTTPVSPACSKIIHQQIRLVQPKVVIAFGEFSSQAVIKANESLPALRATPQHCFINDLPIIATHDLPELLSNPELKADTWADLKQAMDRLR